MHLENWSIPSKVFVGPIVVQSVVMTIYGGSIINKASYKYYHPTAL